MFIHRYVKASSKYQNRRENLTNLTKEMHIKQ